MKKGLYFLFAAAIVGLCFHTAVAEELRVSTSDPSSKVTYQVLEENLILVSATDEAENPVKGLTADDFVIRKGDKTAKIISAESLETNKKIGLNIVLVIDNSNSMKQRKAVDPLLSAMEAFFKTVRPIDNIHIVVFDKKTIKVQGQDLHAKTWHSREVSSLRDFVQKSLKDNSTSSTYLFEAMFAGIDIAKNMPEKENKFLVVFSDGEDINSAFKSDVVDAVATDIPNLEAYCIDYMPGDDMNPFLKKFSEERGGKIYKAKAATEILPIFESFSSKLLHRYVVSYLFSKPPAGTVTLDPENLNFEMLTATNGSPVGNYVFFGTGESAVPEKYALFKDGSEARSFDEKALRTPLDKHLNVLNTIGKRMAGEKSATANIIGCNSDDGQEKGNIELSKKRAESVKEYLANIWGVNSNRLKTEARNLPENPSSSSVPGGSAENRRVEIVVQPAELGAAPFAVEMNNTKELQFQSMVVAEYGVADWSMDIVGKDGKSLKTLSGKDELKIPSVPLDDPDMGKITAMSGISAQIKVVDKNGDALDLETQPVSITVTKKELIHELIGPPKGTLALEPSTLEFEILAMTDGSPVANYVFFDAGESDIPAKYVVFKSSGETGSFDEKYLKTALDRHLNILNIVGKQLTENADAQIRVIGCNSGVGAEKDNAELSKKRAEAVQKYLTGIWGVNPVRIKAEARNLPEKPSSESVLGGVAENRRAELVFDSEKLQAQSAVMVEKSQTAELKITPGITSGYGVADWKIDLLADGGEISSLEKSGDMEPVCTIPMAELEADKLAAAKTLKARVKLTDKNKNAFETESGDCTITVSKKELIHDLVSPPQGSVAMVPQKLTIEELTTIDSSPLLNYIFFEDGDGTIPGRYILFKDKSETADFAESKMKGTMEKYRHILNILGKRISDNPDAKIQIVGCNSSYGKDKGKKLSGARAEAVRAYFSEIWGIDAARMTVTARNKPAAASSNRIEEGRAENRRVEIQSDSPGILDNIKSTYVEDLCEAKELKITPTVKSGYAIEKWKLDLTGDGNNVLSKEGTGEPEAVAAALADIGLKKIGSFKELKAEITVTDKKGRVFKDSATASVKYIKREERQAQKSGYRILEKYALILFDYDSDEIKARNKIVVDQIIERMKKFPSAEVKIVGHTDSIGKEDYNLKLSERRAKAVHYQLLAAGIASGEKLTYTGVGPFSPLYDNTLPEGRALNRTVTVYLEYEGSE